MGTVYMCDIMAAYNESRILDTDFDFTVENYECESEKWDHRTSLSKNPGKFSHTY